MAVTVSGNPIFKAFDSNGDPLVGGKLYSYDAGTSTPRATYDDYELTTPNTNPVILDSRGEATVFLNGSYKLILKDSADVTLWTVDSVNESPIASDWTDELNTIAYVDTNTFLVEDGDYTGTYTVDRAVRLTQTVNNAGHVQSSSYSAVTGHTTVNLYTTVVDGGLSAVAYGNDPDSDSLPGQSATGAHTVVRRDASGDFAANEITADLLGTASMTEDVQLKNGSFEFDIDGDGIPDGWTWNNYTGGTGAIVTTPNAHGINAFSMVHPGGAGNGGGYLDSGYCACSEYVPEILSWLVWDTASAKNIVEIRYYTDAKVYISTATAYSSTATPTTPTIEYYKFTPPSTARFLVVRLIGGFDDTDSAGTTYFGLVSKRGQLFSEEVTTTEMAGTTITGGDIADNTITQLNIGANAVGQSELKTTTSDQSQAIASTATGNVTLTGGAATTHWCDSGGSAGMERRLQITGTYSTATYQFYNGGGATQSIYVRSTYLQSSPPYKIGAETWGHFVFIWRNKSTGEILGTYEAEDPPWAYNGAIWEPKDSPARMSSMPHPFHNCYDQNGNVTLDVNDPAFEIILVDMRDFNINDWKMDALKKGKCSVFEDMQECIPIGKELKHSQFKLPKVTGFTDRVKIRARV